MIYIKHILIILLICPALSAKEIKISFTGDIIMHNPVKRCAILHNKVENSGSVNNGGFDFLFERIAPELTGSDIVLGNMEFPVLPPYNSKPKIFNCSDSVIHALKRAGFTMMGLTNNHILDQGAEGAINSVKVCLDNGLDVIGVNLTEESARAGVVKNFGGITIGFLAYTGLSNYPIPAKKKGWAINWFYDRTRLMEDIRAMRKSARYVIVSVHTGVEYRSRPESNDTALMKECLDAGADLIIGHHPHLIQPIEYHRAADGRDCYIFYSLGNFISNQREGSIKYIDKSGVGTDYSIITHLYLKEKFFSSGLNVRFEIVPIMTAFTFNGTKKLMDVQTMTVKDRITVLTAGHEKGNKTEKMSIDAKLKNVYDKRNKMKVLLFGNNAFDDVIMMD